MSTHRIDIDTAYADHVLSGAKPFEVRRNDRAYQPGDHLLMREVGRTGHEDGYGNESGHWAEPGGANCSACRERRYIRARVSFVYSGDPRWTDLHPGYVVLGLTGIGLSLPLGAES